MDLAGKVVVVPVGWTGAEGLAVRLGGAGATVVLVAEDAGAAGRLAAVLEGDGGPGRPAVFVTNGSDADLDALTAFVAEMFRPPKSGPGQPVDSST